MAATLPNMAAHLPNMAANLPIMKALLKKMQHITGLMDEHYCRRLLISLWIDADRPSTGAEKYEPPETDPVAYKDEFFKDRRNWSRW